VSCAGCQARMGVVVVGYAAAGSGHSCLTAGHRCPTCTTVPRAIRSASIPGEVSSPGPPPRRLATMAGPEISRRLLRVARLSCLPATVRRVGSPHHKGVVTLPLTLH